jgi:predicted HTH domain antitoxin
MPQEFDKIFKENLNELFLALANKVLGVKIVSSKPLSPKLETTVAREADFLREVVTEAGEKIVLHLEFQSNDDREMVYRMAEYKGMMIRKFRIPIRQHVIYLGQQPSKMESQLPEAYDIGGFALHSLRNFDHQEFLDPIAIGSDIPEEILLAVLGDFGEKPAIQVIRTIIKNLQRVSGTKILRDRYLKQLTVLGRLRKLANKVIKEVNNMPILFDPKIKKNDTWYKEGREEKAIDMIVQLLKKGRMPVEEIAEIAETSVEYILNIKSDLEKKN